MERTRKNESERVERCENERWEMRVLKRMSTVLSSAESHDETRNDCAVLIVSLIRFFSIFCRVSFLCLGVTGTCMMNAQKGKGLFFAYLLSVSYL